MLQISVYRFDDHRTPKPPLCKGRCQPNRLTEGLCSSILRMRIHSRQIRNIVPHQSLSQKSNRFLTAPLAQGSLGRFRASAEMYRLSQPGTLPEGGFGAQQLCQISPSSIFHSRTFLTAALRMSMSMRPSSTAASTALYWVTYSVEHNKSFPARTASTAASPAP